MAGQGASELDEPRSPDLEELAREVVLFRELVALAGAGFFRVRFEPPVPLALPIEEQVERILAGGRIVEVNPAFARGHGFARPEELAGNAPGRVFDLGAEATRATARAFVEGGYRIRDGETLELDREGRRRVALNSAIGIVRDRHLIGVLGLQRDVTAERETLARLAESERRFELLFRRNPGALALSRVADGRFLDVNEAFAALVGLPREELVGKSALELGLWPDPEERRRVFAPALERGSVACQRARVRSAAGEEREARISVAALELDGEPCLLALAEDTTELERAQRALAESEARLRAAAEGSPDAFLLLDAVRDGDGGVADFRLAELNRAAARLAGRPREELLGGSLVERCPALAGADLLACYRRVFESGRPFEDEFDARGRGGRPRWLRQQVVPLERGVAVWVRDVTERREAAEERRRLEADFHRSQRLESLGLLAGGVAHDFNNLLTGILGSAELALRRLPPDSDAAAPLRELVRAAQRATDLTEKMLAFAGGGPLRFAWISLNEIVTEMVELARPAIPAGRRLELELARPAPGLEGDATQMRQVVLNLVLNASEAIAGDGGTVRIATGEVYCERERLGAAVLGGELPEGRFAFLSVADDGVGMSREVVERIFEPFFTTKFTGRGLGLAAVLGIVRAHHGAIEVESEPGRGTRFTVLLPLAQPRD